MHIFNASRCCAKEFFLQQPLSMTSENVGTYDNNNKIWGETPGILSPEVNCKFFKDEQHKNRALMPNVGNERGDSYQLFSPFAVYPACLIPL